MKNFTYNDIEFSFTTTGTGWNISRQLANGKTAQVGAALFGTLSDCDAMAQAEALIRIIYPVGVNIVGPDVAHPGLVSGMKMVGPDVTHPNFINWPGDSSSCAP
jgi:hypothetical protein